MVPDEDEIEEDEHEDGPEPRFTPEEIAAAEARIVEQSKRIDFYITEYSVELPANKMRDGEFVVPEYQRAFTWEDERKSRFLVFPARQMIPMFLQISHCAGHETR